MKDKRTAPDLTMSQRTSGGGMCHQLLYLCGHKGPSTGGKFRGRLAMRCPVCNKEQK
jgi:hypothetical protein